MRANLQLETVRRMAYKLQEDHRRIVYETIDMLNSKLTAAEMNIESTMKNKECHTEEAQFSRFKYMRARQRIDKSLSNG
jgi:hypothetical protein